jgi:spore germination protein YaaH
MMALVPAFAFAAQKTALSYAAWLPFWKDMAGANEMSLHLEKFKEISPFSYEVRADGTLVDKLKLNEGFWPTWLSAARDLKIKIIPTIALLDGDQAHSLLSNTKRRQAHEDIIANLVKTKKFDGIDIDYEDKMAKTGPYFSLLLKGLALRLNPLKKILSCTVESRMPLSSRFAEVPKDFAYANDYVAINKYCDEVRIMAYDQQNIDIKLNAAKGDGKFYMPVADPDWVEKVLKETLKTINKSKVTLGIPTYGYEYEVSWANGITTYKRLRSRTFKQAMDLAAAVGATPQRNNAGELSFAYATSTSIGVSSALTYQTSSTMLAAISLVASGTSPVRFVSFSDAKSAQDKISLAKKYGIKGVAFFKFDGETDPALLDGIKI